ncbi:hypothetical protein QBC40DRAFT_333038 [Triangularia verruculosa]|uniref:VIT domain-containing protein n=1 Tax=Triangularia verruculosa TaxID=2587418 RepID=A0AAN6XH60_9PEZI|nr:hypothetical protein QBC40DRAFT_333038 [Triangularia verruculosa]
MFLQDPPDRFSGIISRHDPREPLPAELQNALSLSQDRQPNSHLPEAAAPLTYTTHTPSENCDRTTTSPHPKLPTYTVHEPSLRRNVLPPTSISIEASIIQDTASVTVAQLFWNDSDSIIKEAAYTFPLPSGCTVTSFHCCIGHGKVLTGNVTLKDDALEASQQEPNNLTTRAIFYEQDTVDLFRTNLGNLPAQTKILVTLTYITLLKHHFVDRKGTARLVIPTCIASRYGDIPQNDNDAASTSIPEFLTIQVEVIEARKIFSVTSPTHKVCVENPPDTRAATSFADLAGKDTHSSIETVLVKLESGSTFLDRDFVLDIVTEECGDDNESPQAWIERHPTLPNQQALMLTIPAGFTKRTLNPSPNTEIILLADLSGFMVGKIFPVQAAMQLFLKGIPQGCMFNIGCAGTSYKSWQPNSAEYSEASYHSAASWAAVTGRDGRLPTDIIILTDRETWMLCDTFEYIWKQRDLTQGRVRFSALGIGEAVSYSLVEGIAKSGGGYADVVREASEGNWEDRFVSMAEAALMNDHPGPMHIKVQVMGDDGNSRVSDIPNAEQSPADSWMLSPFNKSRIYVLFDSIKSSEHIISITFTADADADYGRKSWHIPVATLKKTNTMIHQLAALSMLDDLERGRLFIHLGPSHPSYDSEDEINRVRKEAERIACKWSLVSKWTSFFLKEELSHAQSDGTSRTEGGAGDDLLQTQGSTSHLAMQEEEAPSNPTSSPVLTGRLIPARVTGSRPNSQQLQAAITRAKHSQILAEQQADALTQAKQAQQLDAAQEQAMQRAVDMAKQQAGAQHLLMRQYQLVFQQQEMAQRQPMAMDRQRQQYMAAQQRPQQPAMVQVNPGLHQTTAVNVPKIITSEKEHRPSEKPKPNEAESPAPTPTPSSETNIPSEAMKNYMIALSRYAAERKPGPVILARAPILYTRVDPLPAPAPPITAQSRTENRIISQLLRFQSPMGYFATAYPLEAGQTTPTLSAAASSVEEESTHPALLGEFLGKEITNRLHLLREEDSEANLFGESSLKERNLFTTAVCVLLERDFASRRKLWVLMRNKADWYLKEHLERVNEAFEKVKTALEGVKIEEYESPQESRDVVEEMR